MKEINTSELKSLQLKMLVYFDDFCKANNIHYWLNYGTLLGAVRHKGYIPWDDDIDVGMLREDYDLLISLSDDFNNDRYSFCTPSPTNHYQYPFGKVVDNKTKLFEYGYDGFVSGVYLDVFPYDNAPDNQLACKTVFGIRDFLGKIRKLELPIRDEYRLINKVLYRLGSFLVPIMNRININYYIDAVARFYNSKETNQVCCFANPYDDKRLIIERKFFESFITASFEDLLFPIPQDYDHVLTEMYGNYMVLPPESQRDSHHVIKAYLL